MSTIISHNMALGIPSITIYAPDARTIISGTDIIKHLIEVDGEAKTTFIHSVRFIGCVIIADNLRAFSECYFDESCLIKVKSMPSYKEVSINNNFVADATLTKYKTVVETDLQYAIKKVKIAESDQMIRDNKISQPCKCVGGCLESNSFLQNDKQNLPNGVYCSLKK